MSENLRKDESQPKWKFWKNRKKIFTEERLKKLDEIIGPKFQFTEFDESDLNDIESQEIMVSNDETLNDLQNARDLEQQ